jgi:predicted MPP superfamily phosphohydrolase
MPSTRQSWTRRIVRLLLLLVAAAFADSLWLEPNWIEVTHHQVSAPFATPLKIAHLSDLHSSGIGLREQRLLKFLAWEAPDVIVITGDILASGGDYGASGEILSRLHAPLGVWLVKGNRENWHRPPNENEFFRALGVTLLVNKGAEIRPGVWLAGLDDPWSGRPDLEAALAGIPDRDYSIALFHSPLYFEQSAGRYQLALAGHAHGGQVRLPFLKPLWLPGGIGRYVEGWFEKNGSRMYVSRGIGTSFLPIRFDCRPELAIITLSGTAP